MNEITQILNAVDAGDDRASKELLPVIYQQLRELAASKVRREAKGYTLQATELVHEAWLRISADENRRWKNSTHFYAAAAEAMRRILIDRARKKQRARHGGGLKRVAPDIIEVPSGTREEHLLEIHDALEVFEREAPAKAQVVKLKYFVGLNLCETARALDISFTTTERYWLFAKAWLFDYLDKSGANGEEAGNSR